MSVLLENVISIQYAKIKRLILFHYVGEKNSIVDVAHKQIGLKY